MCPPPLYSARFSRVRRAFTLIELLVVIAIIGILAALLFPVFGMVRSRMDSAQCLSQLGQIGMAMGAYINDHDQTLPGPLSFEQSPTYGPNTPGSLAQFLVNYLGAPGTAVTSSTSGYSPVFECPSAARIFRDPTKPTYIVNMLPSPEHGQSVWGEVGTGQQPLLKSALVNWSDATTSGASLALSEIWAVQDGDQTYVAQASDATSGPSADLLPTPAHVDHWNDLFFDFHVASRTSLIVISTPTTPPASGSGGAPSP